MIKIDSVFVFFSDNNTYVIVSLQMCNNFTLSLLLVELTEAIPQYDKDYIYSFLQ